MENLKAIKTEIWAWGSSITQAEYLDEFINEFEGSLDPEFQILVEVAKRIQAIRIPVSKLNINQGLIDALKDKEAKPITEEIPEAVATG